MTPKPVSLPDDVAQAIRTVLDYLLEDEATDYQAASPEGRMHHIFNSLRRVDKWLLETAE